MHIAVFGNVESWYVADLARAARARRHRLTRVEFRQLVAQTGTSGPLLKVSETVLTECEAIVVRTMPPGSLEQVVFRMDALARLERAGTLVLNSPKAIEYAVDKYHTTARLAHAGLPVPETIVCEDAERALEAFDTLGGDVVVKPLFGSEGRGILRVSDPDLAFRTFRTLERTGSVIYLQRFIEHEGFDIRALVLDGRILGGMKRSNQSDFRTNVSRQARGEPWMLTDDESRLALEAAQAVEGRFAGVDLLYRRDGTCYVLEVNAVPGWKAFNRANRTDVAAQVIGLLERETEA
ncbi:MAG: 30S ribosomal protein S6--L-glutamate ligase [Planctomycetaceae bacterium]|nr:30S ribosomal protein S6--L-glutamate ligase [Planctomycetaceae bacterium]